MERLVNQIATIGDQMRHNEAWQHTNILPFIAENMVVAPDAQTSFQPTDCRLPVGDILSASIVNGHCSAKSTCLENGIIIGSLNDALVEYKHLLEPYLNRPIERDNDYRRFNREHFTGGLFVYIPKGVAADRPIRIQSSIAYGNSIFAQTRNIIIADDESCVTLLLCDDSFGQFNSLQNNVTELFIGKRAKVEAYKMQNINNQSALLGHTYVVQQEQSHFHTVAVTLNGGLVSNHCEVAIVGEDCSTETHGLYLIDREQTADSFIYISHDKPCCTSRALYKGIIDDSARAYWGGHVLVREGAHHTDATQTNRNILLTDKATAESKPFLEIYNDDVKCSHGTTTGQLDEQALFYIRSRGISETTAKTLLMYVFCDEVLKKINIEPLREGLSDMVKKRLHGELSACEDCSLMCSSQDGCSTVNIPEIKL